jgi:hypothetical protein
MKTFVLALALTFVLIGGTIAISASVSAPAHADCNGGSKDC